MGSPEIKLIDALAERSKAVAQGAIPQGRGLEPHRRQSAAPELPGFPLANFGLFVRRSAALCFC